MASLLPCFALQWLLDESLMSVGFPQSPIRSARKLCKTVFSTLSAGCLAPLEFVAMAVNAISPGPGRPAERLLAGRGWGAFVFAGALVVAVTWFVIHLPV